MKDISPYDIVNIVKKVKNDFYKPVTTNKISIFLCGAKITDKKGVRYKIAEAFTDSWNSYLYDIVYPEDIFDDLLYSKKSNDLLSLENLLAESIDVIMIIPESAGSLAELGAFSSNEILRKKIVCLLDQKYKKQKSFINQGPVKLIKSVNNNAVIYIDPLNLGKNIRNINGAVKEIKRNAPPSNTEKISLLQLDNFLLPIIYLMEPISKNLIIKFVEEVNSDFTSSYEIVTAALGILIKKKQIEFVESNYKLTSLGVSYYLNLQKTGSRVKIQPKVNELDIVRLEVFNNKYRRKKMKI